MNCVKKRPEKLRRYAPTKGEEKKEKKKKKRRKRRKRRNGRKGIK